MKKSIAIVPLVLGLALSACNKPETVSAPPKPERKPVKPTPELVAAPKSQPAPEETVEKKPTPPPKALAPEGILFAVERISVTTEDGVFSVSPGTRLRIVRKTEDGYVVHDGNRNLTVAAYQVTNELTAANTAAQINVAERTADLATVRAQMATQEETTRVQQSQDTAIAKMAAREKRFQELRARKLALAAEMARLRTQLEQTQYYPRRSSVDPAVRAGWSARLSVAREEKETVDHELRRLTYTQD